MSRPVEWKQTGIEEGISIEFTTTSQGSTPLFLEDITGEEPAEINVEGDFPLFKGEWPGQ